MITQLGCFGPPLIIGLMLMSVDDQVVCMSKKYMGGVLIGVANKNAVFVTLVGLTKCTLKKVGFVVL